MLWLGAAPAQAQPLTDRLPASTMVYIGWSPNASLQTTATAKMLADGDFMGPWRRPLQETLLEMPDNAVEGAESESRPLAQGLLDAAQCEGCLRPGDPARQAPRSAAKRADDRPGQPSERASRSISSQSSSA